ncbi:hypothetical protein D3C76_760490 [compost metagenome]
MRFADAGQVDVTLGRDARIASGVGVSQEERAQLIDGNLVTHRVKGWHQLFADDNRRGIDQAQTVDQDVVGLRGVEHGADTADLADRQHADQQFRAIFNKYADHIAFFQATGKQVVGETVGPLVDLFITETIVLVEQRRSLRVARNRLFEGPPQAAGLIDLELGSFDSPDEPRNGPGDRGDFAQHHAPGNHVAIATHVTS